MTTALELSTLISNGDTDGITNPRGSDGGTSRVVGASVAYASAFVDNAVFVFHKIPVDSIPTSFKLHATDSGTTGDINVGFYPGTIDTATVAVGDAVDEDAIGTAIDINAAALADVEIRFETKAATTVNQKAWELAGLTSKPDYNHFYVCATASEASTAASGSIQLITTFSY